MTKFNPADLIKEIPVETQEAEARQSIEDYLEKVKRDPDQASAQTELSLSIAATLALNLHQAFSRMMFEDKEKGGMMSRLIDASVRPDVSINAAMLAFATVMTKKVQAAMVKDAAKIPDPLTRIAATAHSNRFGEMALNLASVIEKDLSESIDAVLKEDRAKDGQTTTLRTSTGGLHMFRKPNPDTKPH